MAKKKKNPKAKFLKTDKMGKKLKLIKLYKIFILVGIKI